jgi:hypothetical protein
MLGSEAFRQELLEAISERVGPSHYGAEREETAGEKAQRVVHEEMERLGWDEDALWGRRKGPAAKVRLARRLRQETTLSLKWIAQRLNMGSWTCVSKVPAAQSRYRARSRPSGLLLPGLHRPRRRGDFPLLLLRRRARRLLVQ